MCGLCLIHDMVIYSILNLTPHWYECTNIHKLPVEAYFETPNTRRESSECWTIPVSLAKLTMSC